MISIFWLEEYSRRRLKYQERIVLYDRTYIMSMVDPVAIYLETQRIESGCSSNKEFTWLILMAP